MAEGRDLQGNEHLDHRLALEPPVDEGPTPERRHLDQRRSDNFDFDVFGSPAQPRVQRRAGYRRDERPGGAKALSLTLREAECAREDLAVRLGTDRDEALGKIEAVDEAIEEAVAAEGMRLGDALLASVRVVPLTDSVYRARGAARAARFSSGGRSAWCSRETTSRT